MQTQQQTSLFAAAKSAPAKKAKEEKTIVTTTIPVSEIVKLRAEIADREAALKMIEGEARSEAKKLFMDMYLQNKSRPESFILSDGTDKVMFLVTDKYLTIDEAKAQQLNLLGDIAECKSEFSFNPEVLARNEKTISDLIMNAEEISPEDKANLIMAKHTWMVKKGTIDRLCSFGNPAQVFAEIGAVTQIKG